MNSKSTQLLNIPKITDWFYMGETFERLPELLPLESLFEFDSLPCHTNTIDGFEELKIDDYSFADKLSWNEDIVFDIKPLKTTAASTIEIAPYVPYADNVKEEKMVISRRKRSISLELEDIRKYFDMPITEAAKEMKVGLTVLKKRCRQLNIMRWPHRKIKSLKLLINNVKEMGLTNEMVMLEEHKRLVEKVPDMELSEKTKKLRQACFKANYKKKRCLPAHS